jgi:magnesium transporter
MRISLRSPAPSSALIEYLRFQSDAIYSCSSSSPLGNHHGPVFLKQPQFVTSNRPSVQRLDPVTRNSCQARGYSCSASVKILFLNRTTPRRPDATVVTPDRAPRSRRYAHDHAQPSRRRSPSEDRNSGWLKRLFGRRSSRRRPLKGVETTHADDGVDASMFTLGRTITAKAANEQKLRCTEFDENGNVVLVNGEFKKSELIAKVSSLVHIR